MLPETKAPIRHLKEIVPVRVSKWSFLNPSFIKSLEKYDAVILHSMTSFALELIGRASSKTKFVWSGFGFDYYDLIYEDPFGMLEKESSELVKSIDPYFGKMKRGNYAKKWLHSLAYPNSSKKRELVQKVDVFCPVLELEGKLLRKALGHFIPKVLPWGYGQRFDVVEIGTDQG